MKTDTALLILFSSIAALYVLSRNKKQGTQGQTGQGQTYIFIPSGGGETAKATVSSGSASAGASTAQVQNQTNTPYTRTDAPTTTPSITTKDVSDAGLLIASGFYTFQKSSKGLIEIGLDAAKPLTKVGLSSVPLIGVPAGTIYDVYNKKGLSASNPLDWGVAGVSNLIGDIGGTVGSILTAPAAATGIGVVVPVAVNVGAQWGITEGLENLYIGFKGA